MHLRSVGPSYKLWDLRVLVHSSAQVAPIGHGHGELDAMVENFLYFVERGEHGHLSAIVY